MKQIWKYPLQKETVQEVRMPVGAKILYCAMQNDVICLWALVNPENDKQLRTVAIFGTGHDIPHNITERDYYGTVLLNQDTLVLHIFVGARGDLI